MGNNKKRKFSAQTPTKKSDKRLKTVSDICKKTPIFFNELEHIPKSIIQPVKIYETIITRSNCKEENVLWLLIRLFFAIASPDAFYQLRDACTMVRGREKLTVTQDVNTIAQTIQALDKLESTTSAQSIIRRYHLVRLVEHRIERKKKHISQRPERATKKLKHVGDSIGPENRTATCHEGYGRASSMAFS